MPSLLTDLPAVLSKVRTRPLFVMRLDVDPMLMLGTTPDATRRIGIVQGGSFEGERLHGTVLGGGSDWQAVRDDGATTLDVRLVLKASDGALIGMTYRGIRHGPRDVLARLDAGEAVDPSTYYFRTTPTFETASAAHHWLNRIVAVGIGQRRADGPVYSVFEVL